MGTHTQASLRAFLALSTAILCLGCVNRTQIRANLWLNNGLPADLCASEPRLKDYGFYRRLKDGGFEFIPFCDAALTPHMLAIVDTDLDALLDQAGVPQENGK